MLSHATKILEARIFLARGVALNHSFFRSLLASFFVCCRSQKVCKCLLLSHATKLLEARIFLARGVALNHSFFRSLVTSFFVLPIIKRFASKCLLSHATKTLEARIFLVRRSSNKPFHGGWWFVIATSKRKADACER